MSDTVMTEPVPPFTRDQLECLAHNATPDVRRLVNRVADLENALYWIRFQASLYHLGNAFDPIHMWALSSMAHDALAGNAMPDWSEHVQRAQEVADAWVETYANQDKDDEEEESDGPR